jgi:secreted PhoX family phosphatase
MECLKVNTTGSGPKEQLAAFLETQRYASIKGATTEFEKLEGVDLSEELGKWFIAISNIDRAMLDGSLDGYYHDNPNRDDIRLPKNKCGVVIELTGFPKTGPGAWQPTKARVIIAGTDRSGTDDKNACDVNNIASPDNVFVIPGTSTLLIAEDTDHHTNNALWAADISDTSSEPQLTRILSAPAGAEITGLSAATFGAHSYIPMAFQHPDVGRSSIGYLGPFPKKAFAPATGNSKKARATSFEGIPLQTGGANENAVVSTTRFCYN